MDTPESSSALQTSLWPTFANFLFLGHTEYIQLNKKCLPYSVLLWSLIITLSSFAGSALPKHWSHAHIYLEYTNVGTLDPNLSLLILFLQAIIPPHTQPPPHLLSISQNPTISQNKCHFFQKLFLLDKIWTTLFSNDSNPCNDSSVSESQIKDNKTVYFGDERSGDWKVEACVSTIIILNQR